MPMTLVTLLRNTRKTGRPAPLGSEEFLSVWRRGTPRPFCAWQLLGFQLGGE